MAALLASLAVVACATTAAAGASTRASSGCPRTDLRVRTSHHRGARRALVPRGATAVLLCRYRGFTSARPGTLVRARRVTNTATVTRLTRRFDALRPFPARAPLACPPATGVAIVAYFEYRAGPPDPVAMSTTGCPSATNGHLVRSALQPPGPALISRLEALMR